VARVSGVAEVASTDTQLRETAAAIERYLRAFEAGTMSGTLCAPRIAELSQRSEELSARRDQLATQTRAARPRLPTVAQLRALATNLDHALPKASPDVVKQRYAELIDRIDISPDEHAQPYFGVPDVQRPGPVMARACGTPATPVSETPVRMGSHQVVLRFPYSNHDLLREQLGQLVVDLDWA